MLLKTSTLTAPWTIVEGTDKCWARVKVLRTVVDGLCKELNCVPEILTGDLRKARQRKAAATAMKSQAAADKEKPAAAAPDKVASKEKTGKKPGKDPKDARAK
jgi:hypothetical protein